MREIKFRVWDKEVKCFIPLGMIRLYSNGQQEYQSLSPTKWIIPDKTKRYDIQQYTGLKDEHEKEIYEGDIVRYSTEDGDFILALAVFDEDDYGKLFSGFTFQTIREIDDATDDDGEMIGDWDGNLEVIGNIYENPELLKEKS